MLKKTLGTTLVALLSVNAQGYSGTNSHCCEAAPGLASGWYVGAGLGWDTMSHAQSTNFVLRDYDGISAAEEPFIGDVIFDTHYHFGASGLLEEAFLGYGFRSDKFYLAAELFANNNDSLYRAKNIGATSSSGGVQFSSTQHDEQRSLYGIRLRPGYLLACNTLFYVPVGYTRTRFTEVLFAAKNNPEWTEGVNGYQLGWGLEQAISQNISLRFGYLYNRSKNFTIDNKLQTEENDAIEQFRFRTYKTYNDQVVLDIAYHFGCAAKPVQPTCASFGNGFYVGVQGGRSILQDTLTQKTVDLPNDPDNNQILALQDMVRGQGGFAQLFAGYGKSFCNNFYLGAEIFAESQSNKWKSDSSTFEGFPTVVSGTTGDDVHYSFDVKRGYGASLVPGYFISCNTMMYAKLGAKSSRQEFALTNTQGFPDLHEKKDKGAYLVGLGMQTSLGCNLSLRAEFTHTHYGDFNFDFEGENLDPSNPDNIAALDHETHEARVNQFSLGLVYTFM